MIARAAKGYSHMSPLQPAPRAALRLTGIIKQWQPRRGCPGAVRRTGGMLRAGSAKEWAAAPGVVDWRTTRRDLLEQRAAMVWTSTGSQSNSRTAAKRPSGVTMLPAGGGTFQQFEAANPARRPIISAGIRSPRGFR